jgi:hypothetical protein
MIGVCQNTIGIWGISRKDGAPCSDIPPVFVKYLEYLSEQGIIRFMRKTSVILTNTKYSWSWDHAGGYGFVWRGPHSYEGNLPEEEAVKIPLWNTVWSFAYQHERHIVGDKLWNDFQKKELNITPERFKQLEEIRQLCECGEWDQAIALYLKVK